MDILLLHGFPHTPSIWEPLHGLLDGHVEAPNVWELGGDLDAESLSKTVEALLTGPTTVVAIDAAVPAAFLLGLRRPDLLARLVLVEGTLGPLPGVEGFTQPWWFGFHAVPGLTERAVAGNERDYVGWFLEQGTRGSRPDIRERIAAAYAEPGVLARALEFYRALPRTDAQLTAAAQGSRLTVPTVAVGAAPVGRALERQLRPLTDDLTGVLVPDCGHIVPLDRPEALAEVIACG